MKTKQIAQFVVDALLANSHLGFSQNLKTKALVSR